jgi:hypothetical protein
MLPASVLRHPTWSRSAERIARCEEVRVQLVAAVASISEIADRVCRFKCTPHQIAASPDMSRPREDGISKKHIRPGLESLQPTPCDQLISKPPESKSGLVVVEARPADHTKLYVGGTRAVAVAS